MRPIDLAASSGDTQISAQVCVIGAGPVGLTVARRLAERGLDVILLERGGEAAEPQFSASAGAGAGAGAVGFDSLPYGGAGAGRAFGIGGTSALWGGQLLPVTAQEVDGDLNGLDAPWPIRFSEFCPHYETLDRWLGIDPGPFEVEQLSATPLAGLDWTGFAPRYSKWLGFAQRNLGRAWMPALRRLKTMQIWFNARVTGFEAHEGRISTVTARAREARLTVSARRFVIAAGAIESTRLALSAFDSPGMQSRCPPMLGRYLHDHLSLRIARLNPTAMGSVQTLFAPAFFKGTMRTLRLELTPLAARSARVPPAYAHIVADAPRESGFAVLRDLLRAAQRRQPRQALSSVARMPMALPGLLALAYWRATRARLPFPGGSKLYVQLDFQQTPDIRNRIYLGSKLDADGCRQVRIEWNLFDDSAGYAAAFAEHIARFWRRNQLQHAAEIEFLAPHMLGLSNTYDIYHPAGTTRMALDPRSGCVDTNLKLFGTHNLFIAGTSVFPVLGAANPTYTAMALGLRLADHLSLQAA
jgi:choline dehydrogenase-like flavoprotein